MLGHRLHSHWSLLYPLYAYHINVTLYSNQGSGPVSSSSMPRSGLKMTRMEPWIAISRLFRWKQHHDFGRMSSEAATELFARSQDSKAPMTTGSVVSRCAFLAIFLSYPARSDFGASKVTVMLMMIWGVVVVITMSGRRMVPGKTFSTVALCPVFLIILTGCSKITSWRRPMDGRLFRQWLTTCKVVSAPCLYLRNLLSGAERPAVPRSKTMQRRLLWIRPHSPIDRLVRHDASLAMSLNLSSSNHLAILPWLGAPARELVQWLLMIERGPRTALTESQEMLSAITFDRYLSKARSI